MTPSSSNAACPFCKNPNAYQGLNEWECPNDSCRAFSSKQKELVAADMMPELSKEELENRAEEDELAKELQNYGPYIWGYQSTVPTSYTTPPQKTTSATTDPQQQQQIDLLNQLDLLYPNH